MGSERQDKDDAEISGGVAIAEMGNVPGRATLWHKIKISFLHMLRLRCPLEIQAELSRGPLALSLEIRSKMRARETTLEAISRGRNLKLEAQ